MDQITLMVQWACQSSIILDAIANADFSFLKDALNLIGTVQIRYEYGFINDHKFITLTRPHRQV